MKTYTPELKAQVIANWMAGASLPQLAKMFAMPMSTAQGWVKGRTRVMLVTKKEEPFQDTIDDIAWRHVDAGALAAEAILRKTQDVGWLDKQDAPGLAILYGVIADKQLRLLAAYRPDNGEISKPARDLP